MIKEHIMPRRTWSFCRPRGHSLVECVVAMSTMSIVGGIGAKLLHQMIGQYRTATSRFTDERRWDDLSMTWRRDLHAADAIDVPVRGKPASEVRVTAGPNRIAYRATPERIERVETRADGSTYREVYPLARTEVTFEVPAENAGGTLVRLIGKGRPSAAAVPGLDRPRAAKPVAISVRPVSKE